MPEQLEIAGGPSEPVVADPPDPATLLAQSREATARAEGEAAALRGQLAARPPVVTPAPPLTPEVIQGAFERGEITEVHRIQALADLQAQARMAQADQTRWLADARARAGAGLGEYVTAFPDLGKPGSALLTRVADELQAMARDEGADPTDVRSQLRAVKSIVGALQRKDPREFQRERIPVGGSPFSGGGRESEVGTASAPLGHVPPAQLAHWRRLGYTPAEMAAEAKFVKARA